MNDKTGSTWFVCIALQEGLLLLDRVNKAFDAIWTRAYYEYRSGYQCYSTAEEMKVIQERNANYSIVDPWNDSIEDSRLYELLDLDASRRKNLDSIRIRQIMESLGWHYDRRRIEGDQKRGFFKTNWLPCQPNKIFTCQKWRVFLLFSN